MSGVEGWSSMGIPPAIGAGPRRIWLLKHRKVNTLGQTLASHTLYDQIVSVLSL